MTKNSLHMPPLFFLLAFLVALPASAQQTNWYVLAHDDGCVDLKLLVKAEKLSRAPVSPEDFAQMMRERGESVEVGLPAGFPPELAGKVVQVKVGKWKAPLFVKEEVCRNIDKGR
ncbi:MAG: hypothetical protein H6Q57_2175 [Geobacteraceae bacterium]|nr:hypothetical protein [Geobacteraceae bacterium]